MSEVQNPDRLLTKQSLSWIWAKIKSALSGKVDKVNGKGLSTNDYTTAEKEKLAGITVMTGATAIANGTSGLVPAPTSAERGKFLSGSATWEETFQGSNIAIIENTNIATHAILKGYYILWNGTLHQATSNISIGDTLSSSNLTLVTSGGLNSLNDSITLMVPQSAIKNDLITTDEGYVLDARQGKALSDGLANKIATSAIKNSLATTDEGYVLDARAGKAMKDLLNEALFTSIATNTNLNNLTSPGLYGCPNAATAKTLTNNPAGNTNFSMIVINKAVSTYVQVVFTGSMIYTRTKTSTAWNGWYAFTGTAV